MSGEAPARPRVVSLLPSATEALCAIGGGGLLVGRSHECDFPASVAHLPVLTGQRTHATDPAEIDRQVSASLSAGEALYTLDAILLEGLRPDVILTQDLCEVCSIDLAHVQRVAASFSWPVQVVSLNPHTLEGVLDDLLTVGRAVGMERAATETLVRLRGRLFAAEEFVNPYADGPTVGFLEWTDPLFCAGHWTVQMIERAGGRHPLNPTVAQANAGAAAGPQRAQRLAGKSVRVPEEVFVASAPEYVVIAPCGLSLERTRACAAALAQKPWWRDLPAVRQRQVALVDGNQMFNRPGPRLVDAFEWLVGWLNDRPEVIPDGFPWERGV
ncbi:MAG TPA: ABC transporter substrate-binding protein [Phycisphaerales bacterium]|nr:ABC transporter substrate-binding protein [Phycisphaerales bacterium]